MPGALFKVKVSVSSGSASASSTGVKVPFDWQTSTLPASGSALHVEGGIYTVPPRVTKSAGLLAVSASVMRASLRTELLSESSDGAGMSAEAAVATTSMSWAPPSSSKR